MSAPTLEKGSGPVTYTSLLGNLLAVLGTLAGIGLFVATRPAKKTEPAPVVAVEASKAPEAKRARVVIAPSPPPAAPAPDPEPPKVDREAVAKAEALRDAASRDKARAEARAKTASEQLSVAATQAAADARGSKTLAFRVRDPSARISHAGARLTTVKTERDKLKAEVGTLAALPRPKAKVLSNKNPVAKPSDGNESHFEVRHNRVAYIDLDRLMTHVKADAQLRIRLSDGARLVDAKVGPVGAFSLQYVLGRSGLTGLGDLVERRGVSYDLRGWEVVPEFEGRGEAYEQTRHAVSEYARAISRLNPSKATVTLWVYPDGFALYRRLREDLQARGFMVAARPLPDGMAIRGSPSGSLSAGQ